MKTKAENIVWAVFAATLILSSAGCASVGGAPEQTIRSGAASTAPADLQLTCASEAASRLGVDSTKVLPIASGTTEPGVYRVDLNVDGSQAVCMVDSEGSVISVEQAG